VRQLDVAGRVYAPYPRAPRGPGSEWRRPGHVLGADATPRIEIPVSVPVERCTLEAPGEAPSAVDNSDLILDLDRLVPKTQP
jgi:hypothetical protein